MGEGKGEPAVHGFVVSIHIAPVAAVSMKAVEAVRAIPGRGLEGDRYWSATGTYSQKPAPDRDVTLIELEAIEALERDYGIVLAPGESRRNIATRGVALNHLVNRDFTVGEGTLRGGAAVHVAGTTATDATGNIVGLGDPYAQAVQTLRNIEAALRNAGSTLGDVVRTRIYLTNIDDWPQIAKAHAEFFGSVRPATTMVEVSRLITPEMLVEIEADAVIAEAGPAPDPPAGRVSPLAWTPPPVRWRA